MSRSASSPRSPDRPMGWVGTAPAPGRHPGWPARLGPLRVAAGEVVLRPVRLRDASAWSRLRLRDVHHLKPWEPTAPGTWDERHALLGWPPHCSSLRSMARRGMALPFAITVDGEFCGQFTVGNI